MDISLFFSIGFALCLSLFIIAILMDAWSEESFAFSGNISKRNKIIISVIILLIYWIIAYFVIRVFNK